MATFLIDLDSVCNDLWGYIFDSYHKETGVLYHKSLLRTWNFHEIFPHEFSDWVGKFVSKKGFFTNVYINEGCKDALEDLVKDNEIFIVSAHASHPFSPRFYYSDKISWINNHLPFINTKRNLIFSSSKNQIRGDVLVDDSPRNLGEFDRITVSMAYPYNDEMETNFRTDSWEKIWKILKTLSKIKASGIPLETLHSCTASDFVKIIEDSRDLLNDSSYILRDYLLDSLPITVITKDGQKIHPRKDINTNS